MLYIILFVYHNISELGCLTVHNGDTVSCNSEYTVYPHKKKGEGKDGETASYSKMPSFLYKPSPSPFGPAHSHTHYSSVSSVAGA